MQRRSTGQRSLHLRVHHGKRSRRVNIAMLQHLRHHLACKIQQGQQKISKNVLAIHLHVLRVTDQVPSRFQFHMGGKRRVCDAQTSKSEEQAHCCSRKKWPHDMAPGCGMRRSGGCFKRCSCPLRRAPAAQAAAGCDFELRFGCGCGSRGCQGVPDMSVRRFGACGCDGVVCGTRYAGACC